jgi:hypothetical protein
MRTSDQLIELAVLEWADSELISVQLIDNTWRQGRRAEAEIRGIFRGMMEKMRELQSLKEEK